MMNTIDFATQNLDQIEYLLYQSTCGVHFLFDKLDIQAILCTPTDETEFFSLENIDRVQEVFSEFLGKKSLIEKQLYLSNLDRERFEILVRTYFHIVENSLYSSTTQKH